MIRQKKESSKKVNSVKPLDENSLIEKISGIRQDIYQELSKVIVGQEEVIDQILIALLSRGHCVIVGVPGLAKTLLISSLSEILDLDFKRVQFTPDLMPSDITGTEIIQEDPITHKRSFQFSPGPIFTNILLADEINRTPPKTQSALLQAMQEGQVTVMGKTYPLPNPFFVLATQNPVEQEGTYPLPEAQLDRFLFQIQISYPTIKEEEEIIKQTVKIKKPSLKKILGAKTIIQLQELIRSVPVADNIIEKVVYLVRLTRPKEKDAYETTRDWISWGAGPRACQSLIWGAKARAILQGRYMVSWEDILALLHPVMRHRILLSFKAEADGISVEKIIQDLLRKTEEKHSILLETE